MDTSSPNSCGSSALLVTGVSKVGDLWAAVLWWLYLWRSPVMHSAGVNPKNWKICLVEPMFHNLGAAAPGGCREQPGGWFPTSGCVTRQPGDATGCRKSEIL